MAYSDGRAVDIQAPKDLDKGDFIRTGGWNGIALETKASGEYLAMEISSERLHWVNIGELTGAAGAIIYADASTGALTNSAGGNHAALKVIVAKQANKYAGCRLLNID